MDIICAADIEHTRGTENPEVIRIVVQIINAKTKNMSKLFEIFVKPESELNEATKEETGIEES
jgi:hypothetical protein